MPIDFEYLYNKLHKIAAAKPPKVDSSKPCIFDCDEDMKCKHPKVKTAADEELEASKEENEKDDAQDSGAKSDKEKANSDDDDIEDQ